MNWWRWWGYWSWPAVALGMAFWTGVVDVSDAEAQIDTSGAYVDAITIARGSAPEMPVQIRSPTAAAVIPAALTEPPLQRYPREIGTFRTPDAEAHISVADSAGVTTRTITLTARVVYTVWPARVLLTSRELFNGPLPKCPVRIVLHCKTKGTSYWMGWDGWVGADKLPHWVKVMDSDAAKRTVGSVYIVDGSAPNIKGQVTATAVRGVG